MAGYSSTPRCVQLCKFLLYSLYTWEVWKWGGQETCPLPGQECPFWLAWAHMVPGAGPHIGIQHAQGRSIKNRHEIHLNHISDLQFLSSIFNWLFQFLACCRIGMRMSDTPCPRCRWLPITAPVSTPRATSWTSSGKANGLHTLSLLTGLTRIPSQSCHISKKHIPWR